MPHRPHRLKFENDRGSSGLQIKATIDFEAMCCEFTKLPGDHIILHGKPGKDMLIAYEPWIQFSPQNWDEMIAQVFEEMVELWNEKYAIEE